MNKITIIQNLVKQLNDASSAYYNSGEPIMEDKEFDALLDQLKALEEETGYVLSNSPTCNVGARVLTELNEIEHNHPMLSLDKCHSAEEIVEFANGKELVASVKHDGLTISLLYEDGVFVKGETRGNGHKGSDVTEHIKQFQNVPMKINKNGIYIIDGEAVITNDDFDIINKNNEFKNSRNLASGSLAVLDTSLVSDRRLRFVAWDVIEGGKSKYLSGNLTEAIGLGFEVTPYIIVDDVSSAIDTMFKDAEINGYPCDGVVFKFNYIEYGKSLGATAHHFRNGIAFKAKDEVYETVLTGIDWTMGKTATLTPTAVFEPVEIDGTTVNRASLHNVSILTKLDLHIGDTIEVYKANMIIPQVMRNISAEQRVVTQYIPIPAICPVCGGDTELVTENSSTVLTCVNPECKGKLLGKLTHFASKNAMNIDGLSEATLEKFIEKGFVNSFIDIYELKNNFYIDIIKLDGFGKKSVDKLMDAIEKSKHTTLDRFIYSLSIDLIGRSASKIISKCFDGDYNKFINAVDTTYFDWTTLEGFGDSMSKSIRRYTYYEFEMIKELAGYFTFEVPSATSNSDALKDKVFVITGSLTHFANRDALKEKIESLGGKVVGSVSAKTSYLINNDVNSTSSKNKKAKDLNIPIITEEDFLDIIK